MDERTRTLRRVFRCLKRGVYSPDTIDEFTFGRGAETKYLDELLEEVSRGVNRHVFVEGTYGQGKSHFLKVLEAKALKQNYAVSWITLDGYNHASNHLTRYLHSLLENLRLPRVSRRGLANAIEHWISGNKSVEVMSWAKQSPSWLSNRIILKQQDAAPKPSSFYGSDYFIES